MKKTFSTSKGFSLIEVTIALGLVTFVLVALLGLFGVGMKATKQSRDATSLAQVIAQASLLSEYEEDIDPNDPNAGKRTATLTPGDNKSITVHYNADGTYAPTSGGDDGAEPVYTAVITAVDQGNPDNADKGEDYTPVATNFALLKIVITWNGGSKTAFSSLTY